MDPLLEPFTIRHLTLRNRVVSTAHAPAFHRDGHPREQYRLYQEEKAKGGVGLTMIGGSTNIAPDSPSVFGQLYAGDDGIVEWFKELTAGVRRHGAAVMCQITHMGRRTSWDDAHWLPVLGPSAIRERAHRSIPKVMEKEDIDRVVRQFGDAALRCRDGGFDGIELLSHSHLLGQFLSPAVNRRTDDYGGPLVNRLRLTLEVLTRIREVVGPDFIVGIRATGDELTEAGSSTAECVEIAQRIAETGMIDFLNVLAGAPYDDLGLAGWVPPMGTPSAAHLTIAGAIRRAVDVPIIHAGGIADLATARHALTEGHVDLVGMTRAQIADPHLVAKLMRGDENRIRPCAGLGYCVDRVNQGKQAVCGHNAATGREATLHHVIAKAASLHRVVVVGGGPGGLEAARVCAERGHDVVLFEASDTLGGQINLAAKSATRRQISGVADWLIDEIGRLGVDVRYGTYAETDDVLAECPDVVVLATGGWPEPLDIPGGEHLMSSWDVLTGAARPSGDVLLLDEIGNQAGIGCAKLLARSGCQVTLATPDRMVGHELGPATSSVALRALTKLGIRFAPLLELASIEVNGNRKRASLRHVLTGEVEEMVVDHIVVEIGTKPNDELYRDLKGRSRNLGQLDQSAMVEGCSPFEQTSGKGAFLLARIGDAVASRNIHAAVYDAQRVCKDL